MMCYMSPEKSPNTEINQAKLTQSEIEDGGIITGNGGPEKTIREGDLNEIPIEKLKRRSRAITKRVEKAKVGKDEGRLQIRREQKKKIIDSITKKIAGSEGEIETEETTGNLPKIASRKNVIGKENDGLEMANIAIDAHNDLSEKASDVINAIKDSNPGFGEDSAETTGVETENKDTTPPEPSPEDREPFTMPDIMKRPDASDRSFGDSISLNEAADSFDTLGEPEKNILGIGFNGTNNVTIEKVTEKDRQMEIEAIKGLLQNIPEEPVQEPMQLTDADVVTEELSAKRDSESGRGILYRAYGTGEGEQVAEELEKSGALLKPHKDRPSGFLWRLGNSTRKLIAQLAGRENPKAVPADERNAAIEPPPPIKDEPKAPVETEKIAAVPPEKRNPPIEPPPETEAKVATQAEKIKTEEKDTDTQTPFDFDAVAKDDPVFVDKFLKHFPEAVGLVENNSPELETYYRQYKAERALKNLYESDKFMGIEMGTERIDAALDTIRKESPKQFEDILKNVETFSKTPAELAEAEATIKALCGDIDPKRFQGRLDEQVEQLAKEEKLLEIARRNTSFWSGGGFVGRFLFEESKEAGIFAKAEYKRRTGKDLNLTWSRTPGHLLGGTDKIIEGTKKEINADWVKKKKTIADIDAGLSKIESLKGEIAKAKQSLFTDDFEPFKAMQKTAIQAIEENFSWRGNDAGDAVSIPKSNELQELYNKLAEQQKPGEKNVGSFSEKELGAAKAYVEKVAKYVAEAQLTKELSALKLKGDSTKLEEVLKKYLSNIKIGGESEEGKKKILVGIIKDVRSKIQTSEKAKRNVPIEEKKDFDTKMMWLSTLIRRAEAGKL